MFPELTVMKQLSDTYKYVCMCTHTNPSQKQESMCLGGHFPQKTQARFLSSRFQNLETKTVKQWAGNKEFSRHRNSGGI